MFALKEFTSSPFFIKLRSWEYWPFGILQLPIIFYWLWLSVKSRSLVFFTATNPGIEMGGMFGESKFNILQKIPATYIPRSVRIRIPISAADVHEAMKRNNLDFPVIFKPDLGERGFMVRIVLNTKDIDAYISVVRSDFIIQEFVDLPLEFGVFYARYPDETHGRVTSVVGKEMLAVSGDGIQSLRQLIMGKDRARLQWQELKQKFAHRLDDIIPKGEHIELVSIGNHCLGTKFLDMTHLINDQLSEVFDRISREIDCFYFGRFDLRCATIADLYKGNVKILELNGCGAEPAHIYQPGFSFFKAIRVLLKHWKDIYMISMQNRQRGYKPLSLVEARAYYRKFKAATAR